MFEPWLDFLFSKLAVLTVKRNLGVYEHACMHVHMCICACVSVHMYVHMRLQGDEGLSLGVIKPLACRDESGKRWHIQMRAP